MVLPMGAKVTPAPENSKIVVEMSGKGLRIKDILANLDFNGDGVVNEEECKIGEELKAMDKDGDGYVMLKELVVSALRVFPLPTFPTLPPFCFLCLGLWPFFHSVRVRMPYIMLQLERAYSVFLPTQTTEPATYNLH